MKPSIIALSVSLGLLALTAGCQTSQNQTNLAEPTTAEAQASTPIPNSPGIITGQFENGMSYVIRKNAKPQNRAELRLLVKAGSLLEEESQRGFAHFAEHMAFNGTKDFSKNELIDYIESIGMKFGQGLNAYTSYEETLYKLTIPTDDPKVFESGFQVLENWAHKISFEPAEIDKERGVILEEWRRKDSAGWRQYLKHLPTLAKGTRYVDRVVIGTPQIIEKGKHEDLIRYYKKWYQPQNMVVLAVGDFEPEQVKAWMEQYLAAIPAQNNLKTPERLQVPDHQGPLVSIVTDPEATSTNFHLIIDEKKEPVTTYELAEESLKKNLYSRLISARVSELIAKGKIPASQARIGFGNSMGQRGAFQIRASVNQGKMKAVMAGLLGEVHRAAQHGFTEPEFARQISAMRKSAQRMIKEADKSQSSGLVSSYVKSILAKEPLLEGLSKGEFILSKVDSITLAEVNDVGAEWANRLDNRSIVISAPESEKASLPTGDEVLAIWQQASHKSYQPYLSAEVPAQLMAKLPAKGTIVERSYHKKYDSHLWTLSNGAKVVLKQTDFKNDEILFLATSWGGLSMLDDVSYSKAAFVDPFLDYMGVADISAVTMKKFLADKKIGLRTNITEVRESLDGHSTVKDLNHFMQLLHLKIADPRKDAKDFNLIKSRHYVSSEKRFNNPQARFSEEVSNIRNKSNPRYLSRINPESIQQQDLDVGYQHYQQRFANAGDFAFVFVGNLDMAKMEDLVTTYIASLPGKPGEKEQWQAHPDLRSKGHHELHQKDGLNQKAQVLLIASGPARWSDKNKQVFNAMRDVVKVRLRKKIREELGGTYGVSVKGSYVKYPRPEYSLSISFSCKPERVDELTSAIRTELASIQQQGVSAKLIENYIKQRLKTRESVLKMNKFWVKSLARLAENEKEIFALDDELFNEALDEVTVEKVNEAAKLYLNAPNSLYATLLPKDSKVELATTGKANALAVH